MSNNILTELSYRTFDSLLEDVRVDLRGYSLSGRIEPQQLIKVVLRVNYDLGLRINQTKETVIDIEHGKARLPDDFYVMNFALICGEFTTSQILPQGTHIEDVVPAYTTIPNLQGSTNNPCPADPVLCSPTRTVNTNTPICLTKCGTGYQLIQTFNTETRTYKYMLPIRFRKSKDIQCDCPNLNWMCKDEAYLKNGFIYTGVETAGLTTNCNSDCIQTGGLYINYEGALVDPDGNVLVLDHPMINEYYEYALKQRIMENIFNDGDTTVNPQMQLVEARFKAARNNALTITNMPDFQEMHNLHQLNRRAMYARYYEPFYSQSYGRIIPML